MNEEAIKSHLLSGYPVVIAIMAYKGMGEGGSEAYQNKTPFFFEEYASDQAEGKHCVCIIGYDDTMETPNGKGSFLVQNSWGQEWGTYGRFFIPYDVFGKYIPGTKTTYIVHGFVVKM
jgi:C1A family cysteine protease